MKSLRTSRRLCSMAGAWSLSSAPLLSGLLAVAVLAGCGRKTASAGHGTPPNPAAPASYGPPSAGPAAVVPRARAANAATIDWRDAPFAFVETELSPAVLVHSIYEQLDLFAGSTNVGLAAPAYLACATMNGPRTFKHDDVLDVKQLEENWLLVWWAGAEGWTDWDAPWVVYLQHKPRKMSLDGDGLHLEFAGPAGDVVLLPLYGYEKLPQKGRNYLAEHGLAGRKVRTWDWPEVLKRDPLTRLRYWGAALREFPLHSEETIRVDRAADAVTFRSHLTWHSIQDDWHGARLKLAPVSPTLGLAAKLGEVPFRFSRPWFDLDLATPYGPYLVVEGVDQFDVILSVLHYIHETERWAPLDSQEPLLSAALARLREAAAARLTDGDRYLCEGGATNLCRALEGDSWFATALAYVEPSWRERALTALKTYMREEVLVTNRFTFREYPPGSGRTYAVLEPTATGAGLGQGATFGANLLRTLWVYAERTGDWQLIQERWPLVRMLFTTAARASWSGYGREGLAELESGAASCLAFARLAYRAGDMDSYHYACAQFARELIVLFVKQRGAAFFRTHQPWHSMEFMDDEVFVTRWDSQGGGWQLDGPKYPARSPERQFRNRWLRFNDLDVARFYRDWLPEDVRRELNWLHPPPSRRWDNDPGGQPSLLQLRSLLLNEEPAALAAVARPDQFTGPPSGILANCLALLRTRQPIRYERLIPPGPASPFVVGLEREVAEPREALLIASGTVTPAGGANPAPASWPQLSWPSWPTPTGAPWTFGMVRPGRRAGMTSRPVPLNWNTRAIVYQERQ